MCQTGTQSDSDESFKEHGATQTSLMTPSICMGRVSNHTDNTNADINICPLCGRVYRKSLSFTEFHEHVLSHFTEGLSVDGFELVQWYLVTTQFLDDTYAIFFGYRCIEENLWLLDLQNI